MEWILFTLVFGICKGIREGLKKKALERNSTIEVLFLYTLIGFIFVIPTTRNVFNMPPAYYFYIGIKALIVVTAWMLSFNSIKHMPVSLYGVMDMARVLFSTLMGISFMGESTSVRQLAGLLLVIMGLVLVNVHKKENTEVKRKYLFLTLVSSLMNATSGVLDKWLTKTVTDSQLQFWFMLFMVMFYGIFILFTGSKIDFKAIKSNCWIVILSVVFVIGDRALFIANSYPESRITVMTLIKQSSVITAIIAGRIIFGEKGTLQRLICALIIVAGILIAVV